MFAVYNLRQKKEREGESESERERAQMRALTKDGQRGLHRHTHIHNAQEKTSTYLLTMQFYYRSSFFLSKTKFKYYIYKN